jgi:hypothetical protein
MGRARVCLGERFPPLTLTLACPLPLPPSAQDAHMAVKGSSETARTLRSVLGDQLLYLSSSTHLLALANVIAASSGDLEPVVAAAITALALDR